MLSSSYKSSLNSLSAQLWRRWLKVKAEATTIFRQTWANQKELSKFQLSYSAFTKLNKSKHILDSNVDLFAGILLSLIIWLIIEIRANPSLDLGVSESLLYCFAGTLYACFMCPLFPLKNAPLFLCLLKIIHRCGGVVKWLKKRNFYNFG